MKIQPHEPSGCPEGERGFLERDTRSWILKTASFRLIALAVALTGALIAAACSVPVFRYALEHWKADKFEAFVFHRGPLSAEQQELVRMLGPSGLAGELHANISPITVDLDQNPDPGSLAIWQQSEAKTLPWLLVRFPSSSRSSPVFWSGPLQERGIRQLLESPARREIAQRLGQGESAVWVIIESGDGPKDDAIASQLQARLDDLMETMTLPKLDMQDIANGLVSVGQEGLRLAFSVIRVSREDKQEEAFVRMLLGSEAGLWDSHEPVVVPVFGRGRALYALVGKGIRREVIDQAAAFLIGKCSCQVKEQNPGNDLLMSANWDKLLQSQAAALPDLPSLAELAKSAPEVVRITGDDEPPSPREKVSFSTFIPGIPNSLSVTALALGLLAIILWIIRRK